MTVPADTRRGTRVLAPALACGMVLIIFLLSLWLRNDSFHGRTGADDLEASYHVLWTMHALDETPVGVHLLLPTVTLAALVDFNVLLGLVAAITTANGSFRIWGSTEMVRGYLNLAVDADIYERMTPKKLQARGEGRSCDVLLLDTRTAYRDQQQIRSITLWPAAGPNDPITFTPTDDAGPS